MDAVTVATPFLGGGEEEGAVAAAEEGSAAVENGNVSQFFNWKRAGLIFRDAAGHINPSTATSRGRLVRLFEKVGSTAANLRTDAVTAGLTTKEGAAAGIQAYTQVTRNGKQIWVSTHPEMC